LALPRYFTGFPCKAGHVCERQTSSGSCVKCGNLACRARYWSDPKKARARVLAYTRENKTKRRAYVKKWYRENKKESNERSRVYHAAHRKERSIKRKKRRASSDVVRVWERKYAAERSATDLEFRIMKAMRARLTRAINTPNRAGSAVDDLGCSIEFFKNYIASKFRKGMSWKGWPHKWQLDHIRPIALFDLTDRQQFLEVCHYTIFQPLSIAEHREKTAREQRKNNVVSLREAAE
jgi:hypothetical protein